jgi:3'-phosphoadenosine 5'-phosphosulfate sulfotransferase (PAPS reductase)/FAD synthetase
MGVTMPAPEREKFLLWSLDSDFVALVAETEERLAGWASEFESPCVAFSGGKDSTVMLHLALRHWPGERVLVWHWDYGEWLMPRPFQREVLHNLRVLTSGTGARLRVDMRPGGMESRHDSATGYRAFFGALHRAIEASNCDVNMSGLRASESGSRRRRVRGHREVDRATRLPLLFPVADWRALCTTGRRA